jgi:NTP pyrophosphatase (non-canonical NTP hydrolase)
MHLNEYQDRAAETDLTGGGERGLMIALLGLAGEVGELAAEQKKRLRDGEAYEAFGDRVAEELGDLLWYVAGVARRYGLDLETVAERNLEKNRARWRGRLSLFGSYDDHFPEAERLPKRLRVRLEDVETEDGVQMVASVDDEPLGAALTDNARDDDGYRFHDVMHLAHAAVLRWSPVIRAITGRKRRSDEVADEVEDGGRAAVVEEGIVALVWTHARERSFYEGVDHVDYDLLRTLAGMTAHLEVADRTPSDWERAILIGYDVWRQVRAEGGGVVTADLERGTLTYEPLGGTV